MTITAGADLAALRQNVRLFLRKKLEDDAFTPRVDPWLTGWDEEFSAELAERGWVGITIPTEYGGQGRTFLERFVVTEELVAHGAPVAAHWIADRQIAPSLLRFGSAELKQRYLPRIARGQCFFGIGMSEPDSGSDLASVRTRAVQAEGGWRISGTKVWTSNAHRSHAFFALARTAPLDDARRHAGLSQFVVDLKSAGVTIRPIISMGGHHHFNEVHLDEVFVPDADVLGTIGDGWKQVTSELGFERSGPERLLSTFPLLVDDLARYAGADTTTLGQTVARLAALRQLSFGVAVDLQDQRNADVSAALVKLLGTQLEGDIVEQAALAAVNAPYTDLLTDGLMQRAGFTLRGGASEVLRGVVARGLGLR
jgi:alkylation response protein AidB-like acyl-CoA dehydrogenase